ncbi:MAG: helical backbone metal receptor [Flavobacteriales bacterium]
MSFNDQIGNTIYFSKAPQRIVSLVPSQSEFLYDLGLGKGLVGVTKFCVHPEHLRKESVIIGGTKQIKVDKIKALKPDLVVANKEENTKEDIKQIKEFCQVYVSDIKVPEDAISMMSDVASLLRMPFSEQPYLEALAKLKAEKNDRGSALYLIWRNPYMAAGGDTYINRMLELCGFKNVLKNELRYPELDEAKLVELNPDWVLLSSEPFPFKEKHIAELQVLLPNAKIELVDGEAFSWYGSRILPAVDYLIELTSR